jgi:hypothetical protein
MSMQEHNRKGLYPLNPNAQINYLKVAATQTLAVGDVVGLTSGQVRVGVATDSELVGVMAEASVLKATNSLVAVYTDPDEIYVARMDGTTTKLAGEKCDLIGGTGAMQLDADADTYHHFVLIRPIDVNETSTAVGAQWAVRLNLLALSEVSA